MVLCCTMMCCAVLCCEMHPSVFCLVQNRPAPSLMYPFSPIVCPPYALRLVCHLKLA